MKKMIISTITAILVCFNTSTPLITNATNIISNNTIDVNIGLSYQTKGGGYIITLTDNEDNTLTQTIKTSGSTANFSDVLTDVEYKVTITHLDNPTQLWYYGTQTFSLSDYDKTVYIRVSSIPVEDYTFSGNYTSLEDESARIGVAGAYANVNEATIYKGYFQDYISSDYQVVDILTTFHVNGFVTGDDYAFLVVDLFDYLPANFAVVKLDSTNNDIIDIYYNTNGYPISRISETMFTFYMSDFAEANNFAVVELTDAQSPEINLDESINYNYTNFKFTPNANNSSNFSTGGSIPTTGYISAFRNVSIGDIINLDALNIYGVEGWYYDIIFKNPVKNTSSVEVTKEILVNGLYPKYSNSIHNRSYSFFK